MSKTASLAIMSKEIEEEIITRKRLYAGRAKAGDPVAIRKIETMKAVADLINRVKEAQETGHKLLTEWKPLDPGQPLPDYVEGPALLSAMTRGGAAVGGYRTETLYLAAGQRAVPTMPIYAWADVPPPAVITEESLPCIRALID